MGYEFPACNSCNHSKRLDEQSLALLVRIIRFDNETNIKSFQNTFQGVRNNNPVLAQELKTESAVASKTYLKTRFGSSSNVDKIGLTGWRSCTLGPESNRLLDNMCIWFAQTAWYMHCKSIFSGKIIWTNVLTEHLNLEPAQKIISNLIGKPIMMRNGKNVSEDFFYRYFSTDDLLISIFQFGKHPQLVFVVCATKEGIIDPNIDLPQYWKQHSIELA
ncbi:hypothetical protein [Acetobacter sp. P1H12_c]|uniref:hypothetical protein n=1 Tax=Acetobacter sp. P1H12_c TaxID=2762621 RepID=UPI001C04AFAF|nr:hypothetical protein [Acetobacter sp. P1H12_c]